MFDHNVCSDGSAIASGMYGGSSIQTAKRTAVKGFAEVEVPGKVLSTDCDCI